MEYIKIGQIVNVVGLKGEVKIYHYTDYKERFEEIKTLYIDRKAHEIGAVRYLKNMVIIKLSGIDNRNQAETYKGKDVFITLEDMRILPEGTYYIKDLKGLTVIDESGEPVGILCDVIQNGAQDIYEIERENKNKFLIPAVEEFILKIDMDQRIMTVHLIDGLMDS